MCQRRSKRLRTGSLSTASDNNIPVVWAIRIAIWLIYFIGFSAFQHQVPFACTLLVEWRKRVDLDFVKTANDLLCDATPEAFRFRKRKDSGSLPGYYEARNQNRVSHSGLGQVSAVILLGNCRYFFCLKVRKLAGKSPLNSRRRCLMHGRLCSG